MNKFRILSPDGIDIAPNRLYEESEFNHEIERFKERFKAQGYYSSAEHGRIELDDLEDWMQFVEVEDETTFEWWVNSDNVIKQNGKYYTQCSQYVKGFTLDELKVYWNNEYGKYI